MTEENVYRPCVGIALFNADGLVFVGERIDTPGAWQMPQGGIDEDEDIEVAAFRELYEEVGTDKAEIIRIAEETIRYDIPERLKGRLWKGRYIGQEQTWIAMRFTGEDSDIRLDLHKYPEFSRWEWIPFDEIVERIVPFKQDTYRKVIELFSDITG